MMSVMTTNVFKYILIEFNESHQEKNKNSQYLPVPVVISGMEQKTMDTLF